MLKNKHTVRQFSESFKLKVLSELSDGKYTKRKLSLLYNIGYATINDWIKKYDREVLISSFIKYLKYTFKKIAPEI